MRVLGISRDETACNYYRVALPLSKLVEHKLAECVLLHDYELSTSHALEKVLESDAIIFQRPANDAWFDFIKLCQKHGKIIISDYDDDPFNTSPMNPYYRVIGTEEWWYKWPDGTKDQLWKDGENGFNIERNIMRRDMFTSCFKKSDLVTTTTDILQGTLSEMNENTVILPNCMDLDCYQKPEMVKNEVRISYQCGSSHYEDIYMFRDALIKVINKHDNVKFIYFGDYRFWNMFQDIPTSRKEFHGFAGHRAFPYKLCLLNIDIGVCPLVNNTFNQNKSAIKHFEYTLAGATTISTDIPPYKGVVKHNETGLLTDNDNWEQALDELIQDKEKRIRLQKNAYEDVRENHNIDKKIHLWKEAYEKVLKKELVA